MPVAFPTAIWPESVTMRPRWAVARWDNPISLHHEVQELGGFRWEIDIRLQRMGATEAGIFAAFLVSLKGGAEAFSFDLDPWAVGISPAPGTRNFLLADPATAFDTRLASWGFTFAAVEDIGE